MKFALVVLSCALWEASGYPYYPYYGNVDSLSYGSSDSSRGGMVLSRYYNPYYNTRLGGGMAAFMYKQPEEVQPSQYYMPDRRRQTPQEASFNLPQDPNYNVLPQENEVFYPQQPQYKPLLPTEQTEIAEPTEKTELSTTVKTLVPEIVEPEIEPVEQPRRVSKKVKRPVMDEEDDEQPKMPAGAFFPMFFGWGRNGGGTPGGATAIANAYSTSRGGVASSHATAYGMPTPDLRNYKDFKAYQPQQ